MPHCFRFRIILALLAAGIMPLGAAPVLRLTADRPEPLYQPGETVWFTVGATDGCKPLTDGSVRVRLADSGGTPLVDRVVHFAVENPVRIGATLDRPGFVTAGCETLCDAQGAALRPEGGYPVAAAAFAPERIQPGAPPPDDFAEFWAAGRAAAGPGRIELTPFTARSYKNHNAWRMEITVRGDEKLYGVLCVPKTPGRYPALITIPGAGPGTAAPWIDDADGELIILLVNVHRYEPSVDRKLLAEQYRECNAAAGMPYMFEHAEDRERYFYRRVFLGLAQAADHVAGMKEFDGKNMGVTGSSQGAAAALALAAINHRITAVAVNVPAMCDHDGWRVGRKSGWPEWHRNRPDGDAVAPYYDGCNFARLIEAPVFMAVGFNDLTAPAAGGYAAWNLLRGEKTMLPMFDRGHEIPDFCGRKMRYFLRSHGIGR